MIFNPRIEEILDKIVTNTNTSKTRLKITLFVIQEQLSDLITETVGLLIMFGLVERDFDNEKKLKLRYPLYIQLEVDEPVGKLNSKNITSFIEANYHQYRARFGTETKTGGLIGYKPGSLGDEQGGIKKMIAWFKQTKFKYSWEDVLNATDMYVSRFVAENNFTYMKQADYFIMKDQVSMLSSLIDDGKNYTKGSQDLGIEYELV